MQRRPYLPSLRQDGASQHYSHQNRDDNARQTLVHTHLQDSSFIHLFSQLHFGHHRLFSCISSHMHALLKSHVAAQNASFQHGVSMHSQDYSDHACLSQQVSHCLQPVVQMSRSRRAACAPVSKSSMHVNHACMSCWRCHPSYAVVQGWDPLLCPVSNGPCGPVDRVVRELRPDVAVCLHAGVPSAGASP